MRRILFILLAIGVIACKQEEKNKVENSASADVPKAEGKIGSNVSISKKDSSLQAVNEKIRASIDDPDLYLERSKIYLSLEDDKAAIADIDRAFGIDSTHLPTLLAQADFLMQRGKVANGLSILEKASALYPESSDVYVKMGEIFLTARNLEKALKNADLGIKYDQFNAQAYYIKGYAFLELGDTTRAISSYQTTVEQDPEHFDAYLELGLIYSVKNDPLALNYFNNALSIKPNEKRALYSRGMYEQEHQLYNEAIQTYHKAVTEYPDFKEGHYNLGYVHMYYLKLYREATQYFTDAIKIDPRYFQAYYNRGYSFELMGDINNAAKDYRQALKIAPTYDLAANGLERVTAR